MIVVDASALVDALVAPDADEVRDRLRGGDLSAPTLLDYEVHSALRGLVRAGLIGRTQAVGALADLADLPLRRWPIQGLLARRAFDLSLRVSSYDAAYVALAEALDCPLMTRDRRLAQGARDLVAVENL